MDQGHLWVVRVRARRRGEFVDAIADIQADGKVLIISLKVTPVSAWKTSPVQAVTFPSRCASCTGVNLNLRQHYPCHLVSEAGHRRYFCLVYLKTSQGLTCRSDLDHGISKLCTLLSL